MQVAVFSTKPYDQRTLLDANEAFNHEFTFYEPRLTLRTVRLAEGFDVVCAFVNDQLDRDVLRRLAENGTRMIALRCTGFNNVDLEAAADYQLTVARVPSYSPHAVAEHTIGLILTLARKLHRAYNRTRDGNFSLDGLLGFDLHGKTAGVVGTGQIGRIVAEILRGFGCRVLAHDLREDEALKQAGVEYVPLETLIARADIITLHCPLLPATYHLINEDSLRRMRDGVMLVNTSRGALVDSEAVILALKDGKLGSLALDVYEEEADVFFEDYSTRVIQDDVLARLLTFPNVMITGHQAFFTAEALESIARQTLENIRAFEQGREPHGLVRLESAKG